MSLLAFEIRIYQNLAMREDIQDFKKSGVKSLAQRSFRDGASFSCWQIEPKDVRYLDERTNTLSLYLQGGEYSYRYDQRSNRGGPGLLCLMPQGQISSWHVSKTVRFSHFYFTDAYLKEFILLNLERELGQINLPDLTYHSDPFLKSLIIGSMTFGFQTSIIKQQELSNQILYHLIEYYLSIKPTNKFSKTGLGLRHKKILTEYIGEHYAEKLTLEQLAQQVELSPFHFSRLFKKSFGLTPGDFIQAYRVEKVRSMLASGCKLSDISFMTGFSHQSHMTQSFKRKYLLTPAQYRKQLAI